MINTKLISKNATLLTARLIISTIVSLFTSRVVLEVLGVDNFGIFGLVGGIVALLNFMNATMSIATSRFITYKLGLGDEQEVNTTFSTAFWIHILLAVILVILGETIGLWFVNNKLNIPSESMFAANVVYQLSLFSAVLSLTQIPYTACIMAYEKMGVYAYLELGNTILRLVIVYLLVVIPGDKLITYAILQFVVSLILLVCARVYCIKKISTTKIKFHISKGVLKPMLAFTSWNTVYSICIIVRRQGIAVIINMFFGVALNAAASLATTVTGVVGGLFSNILTAFQPQIVKNYAGNDICDSQRLMEKAVVFSAFVFSCVFIPIYLDIDFVLSVWLVEVPAYVSSFIKITLLASYIEIYNNVLNILIQARGKLKVPSIFGGALYVLQLPLIWVVFKIIPDPNMSYVMSVIILGCVMLYNIMYVHHYFKGFRTSSFVLLVVKVTCSLVLACVATFCLHKLTDISIGWYSLIVDIVFALIASIIAFYFISFSNSDRIQVRNFISKKFFSCKIYR